MKELFNDYVQSLETYIMFQIKEKMLKLTPELTTKGRKPISLSMGAPSFRPPEFAVEALKKALDETPMHTYTTSKGEKFFLDAVKTRMKNKFEVDFDSSKEICSLIGSKEGIANLIRALINPVVEKFDKDIILVPDPAYASYKEMVKVSGGYGYSMPLVKENNFMPDLEKVLVDLEKEGFNPKKVKAVLINYPNNPLGATATKEYFQHAVDFCRKHNVLLISDAAYIDSSFEENQEPLSIFSIENAKDIAVEFFSFSKSYAMTGWRLGWVCGNAYAISFLAKLKSTIDTGVFRAVQKAGAEILNSKEGDDFIAWSNQEYKRKQSIIVSGLKELGWVVDNIPSATFYLWLPIPPKYKTSKEFADDLLEKSGVVVVPGNSFGIYGEGFFRASIVCSDEELHEVIDRMKKDGFTFNLI